MTGTRVGENPDDRDTSPGSSRYIETIISELRTGLNDLRQEVRAVSALAAAAQNQVSAHVAVCDERQRQMEVRQVQRDRWHEDQARITQTFMDKSAADRANLRTEIITASQAGRTELRDWSIKLLACIAGANLIGAIVTISVILKGWGH